MCGVSFAGTGVVQTLSVSLTCCTYFDPYVSGVLVSRALHWIRSTTYVVVRSINQRRRVVGPDRWCVVFLLREQHGLLQSRLKPPYFLLVIFDNEYFVLDASSCCIPEQTCGTEPWSLHGEGIRSQRQMMQDASRPITRHPRRPS